MIKHLTIILSLPLLLLTACQTPFGIADKPTHTAQLTPTTQKTVESTVAVEAATTAPSTAEPITTTATLTAPVTKAPSAIAAPVTLPGGLFDVAWDDRRHFAAGLQPAERLVLTDLPHATVYHLDLTITPALTQVVGNMAVRYANAEIEPLDEVVFRLFPNVLGGAAGVTNVTLNGGAITPTLSLSNSALTIPFATPLSPGQAAVIGMAFTTTVPTDGAENYASFIYSDGLLTLPHSYPMIPAYDDEGWNVEIPPHAGDVVYADSSFYLVRITAPQSQTLVTSGVAIDRQTETDAEAVIYAAGPVRDFYLATGDNLEQLTTRVGSVILNAYAPVGLTDANRQAQQFAIDALNTYTDAFGPYPFTELDLIATPTTAGGIEYPGVVAVSLDLYRNPEREFFEFATAHEVGHQWFYSVVGNDQVDEPWLDESLTQYLTQLYFGAVDGEDGAAYFQQQMTHWWAGVGKKPMPIGLPVAAYTDNEYGAIVYGRGPLFFNALREEMGAATFDAFLRGYFAANKWGTVDSATFKTQAETACNCDLNEIFNEWVFE